MLSVRIIPCLLLKDSGLVKTLKFKNPKYLGDPINIVRIFNDKEVDELVFLDISSTKNGKPINYEKIKDIASECFMPLSYGGGIKTVDEIRTLLGIGVEKVAINSATVTNSILISQASRIFGSSTIIASIDVKKNLFGKYEVYINGGSVNTKIDPVTHAQRMQELGAGEILINSIDRDGTMKGFDTKLIELVSSAVSIPVIACGGAGNVEDLRDAVINGKASAVAAGSMFVFQGPHRAVLISYPTQEELKSYFR